MTQAPERIFLQDAGDYDGASQFEVTWCCEPQDDADTEYIRADLVPQWQPIETAPKGVDMEHRDGVCWMMLAVPDDDGGYHRVSGMRVGDKFYAEMTFYCGYVGTRKHFALREAEVSPTHWMPLPAPPK